MDRRKFNRNLELLVRLSFCIITRCPYQQLTALPVKFGTTPCLMVRFRDFEGFIDELKPGNRLSSLAMQRSQQSEMVRNSKARAGPTKLLERHIVGD